MPSDCLRVVHAAQLLGALCGAAEYDELPVRHNEDRLNAALSAQVRYPTDIRTADEPHTKANLLLQVRPNWPGACCT